MEKVIDVDLGATVYNPMVTKGTRLGDLDMSKWLYVP